MSADVICFYVDVDVQGFGPICLPSWTVNGVIGSDGRNEGTPHGTLRSGLAPTPSPTRWWDRARRVRRGETGFGSRQI